MTRAIVLAAALSLAPVVHADAAETLARVAVLESGFSSTADHVAIWSVLRRRADRAGWPIERMAVAYSSPMRRGHWPAWAATAPREAWDRVRERARLFLGGRLRAPCQADHWGDARGDLARALRAGWRRVGCGPTRNLFWATARPSEATRHPSDGGPE
jgi:hypothetical protein